MGILPKHVLSSEADQTRAIERAYMHRVSVRNESKTDIRD